MRQRVLGYNAGNCIPAALLETPLATQPQTTAEQTPLLQTKLYIPSQRPELITRGRLIERLHAGLHGKLTLVAAPAGFGKTTLVSDCVATCGRAVAWLHLDESDNDPARFLTYLIAALRTVREALAEVVLTELRSPQPPPAEVLLAGLINELSTSPDPLALVLDDYHLIEAQPVHDALAYLLQHLPPQVHLVIATRVDPPLPLSRLRARGQLTELRARDLRFTPEEAADFLNRGMGLALSEDDVAALEQRTEGWIAGLQLAAISMRGVTDAGSFIASFTGSHRFVLDYLVEEVLDQQPPGVQDFLLKTAILDRLSGPLCDAVTGQADGQDTLEMLDRANLFVVPLDGERRWYRYHHLFADLLRQRLQQQGPTAELYRRASVWCEENGEADSGVEYALRGGDASRAADLVADHEAVLWQRGEQARLRRWLEQLSEDQIAVRPRLCVILGWHHYTSGRLDEAERYLDLAVEGSVEAGDALGRQIRGRAASLRAYVVSYRGDVEGTIRTARAALDDLPAEDSVWRTTAEIALGDAYRIAGRVTEAAAVQQQTLATNRAGGNIGTVAALKLAETLRQQGQLDRAIAICRQYLDIAQETGLSQTVAAGSLKVIWGETLVERGELDAATELIDAGLDLIDRGADVMVMGWGRLRLARLLLSKGELDGIETAIARVEALAQHRDLPVYITSPVAAWKARVWLGRGDVTSAAGWATERGLGPGQRSLAYCEPEYIVLARILIAQGDLDAAMGLLRRLSDTAEEGGHTARLLETLLLQALAYEAAGRTEGALQVLEQALGLGEPSGFVHIFVDEGPSMGHLLHEAASRGVAADYARKLLTAFPVEETEGAASAPATSANEALVEPLSARELEVLGLIAQGHTNPEIATKLFLSLNTVKVHTRNIYGKLGAHSRTQAVARGRALGVLQDD